MKKLPHPRQPVVISKNGVARFKANAMVRFLLNNAGPFGLNYLATREPGFSKEDWTQFYQLIGCSLESAGELQRTLFDRRVLEEADKEAHALLAAKRKR